jgi:hypothetical protein
MRANAYSNYQAISKLTSAIERMHNSRLNNPMQPEPAVPNIHQSLRYLMFRQPPDFNAPNNEYYALENLELRIRR